VGAFAFDEQPIEAVKMFKLSNRTIIRIGEDPVEVFEEGENAFVLEIIRQDRPMAILHRPETPIVIDFAG
jgi:hypothetical protein